MIAKLLTALSGLSLAGVILLVSVAKAAGSGALQVGEPQTSPSLITNFELLPNSPLWPFVVAGDKIRLATAANNTARSVLLSHLAQERVDVAQILIDRGEYQAALSTIEKSAMYLDEAQRAERLAHNGGEDSKEAILTLAKILKTHQQRVEQILSQAPENIRPHIIEAMNGPREVGQRVRDSLFELQAEPKNPPVLG